MTWPIVEGTSLMHLHLNRGKRSLVLDLRTEAGVAIFKELATGADVVVEAMRPGALARRGVGYDDLRVLNPKIVFCTISGYGMTGPYRDYPSHGIAYDTWAGIVNVATDDEGFTYIPEHVSIGINAGPLFGALGILAAVIRARATGEGSYIDIAQSDAAAAMDWYRTETLAGLRAPRVRGDGQQGRQLRAPGAGHGGHGRGRALPGLRDRRRAHVLFMASEQAFWKNFCEAVDRMDLFERWPGSKYADHARGNRELQRELRDIFATKTAQEWLEFGGRVNTPIAPVNTPQDAARRSPVRRPPPTPPGGGGGSGPALHAAALRRRGAAAPGQGAHGRPAHRGRLALGARL